MHERIGPFQEALLRRFRIQAKWVNLKINRRVPVTFIQSAAAGRSLRYAI